MRRGGGEECRDSGRGQRGAEPCRPGAAERAATCRHPAAPFWRPAARLRGGSGAPGSRRGSSRGGGRAHVRHPLPCPPARQLPTFDPRRRIHPPGRPTSCIQGFFHRGDAQRLLACDDLERLVLLGHGLGRFAPAVAPAPASSLLPASLNLLRELPNVAGMMPYLRHISAAPMSVETNSTTMSTRPLAVHRFTSWFFRLPDAPSTLNPAIRSFSLCRPLATSAPHSPSHAMATGSFVRSPIGQFGQWQVQVHKIAGFWRQKSSKIAIFGMLIIQYIYQRGGSEPCR